MSTDAKIGLVIGVGLVITVGAVYFRKDSAIAWQSKEDKAVIPGRAPQPKRAPSPRNQVPPAAAKKNIQTQSGRTLKEHTVQDGETLYSLAIRYFGDGDKFVDIYRCNRDILSTPDLLIPGTVLTIPNLEKSNETYANP
jgi:nucleoid-associated protein YgaU